MYGNKNKQKTSVLINSKLFILFYILVFSLSFVCQAHAVTLTHPEQKDMIVDEDGIFFSGKISKYEKVFINGIRIKPSKFGAFSYSVPLQEGENIIAVQSKEWTGHSETIKYTITRISPEFGENYNKFVPHEIGYYVTTRDNVVLRSTPIDKGMNRLGYLPQDTKVVADGTHNEFSRIYLTKDKYAWAMTKDLKKLPQEEEFLYIPKTLVDKNHIKTNSDITYTYTMTENTPYSAVVNDNKLVLTIYNLDNGDESYEKTFTLDKFPRYSICMQNGILYLTFKNCPVSSENYSNKNVKIVIDPGHGGQERGAVGCLGDIEKNYNLKVALCLKKILLEHNFDVILTRETDKFISLEDRVKFAKDNDALIFVSIHMNSVHISDDPNLNEGTLTFYFNPQSKNAAKIVSKSLAQNLKVSDGGATQASFAVIRPTEYIGILSELVYLVNPKDVSVYKNKKFINTSAQAIYQGLINYIHSELE